MDEIAEDIERLRTLHLDRQQNQVNRVMARLEYRLTKSYLRYVAGQRFGYMNPSFVLNRLDTVAPNPYDTIKLPVRFRELFDVKMEHLMIRSLPRRWKESVWEQIRLPHS